MPDSPAKKRFGRPPKPAAADAPARSTFSVRLRSEVRAALLSATEKSGRSISEEVESRLEQSLAQQNDEDGTLGRIVAQLALSARHKHDCSWPDDKVFATYLYTRICIALAARMGVPVMSGAGHDINFTLPGYDPTPEMQAEMRAAADMAWDEERGGVKRPSFAKMVEQYRQGGKP